MEQLELILTDLRNQVVPDKVQNPYSAQNDPKGIKVNNLRHYLNNKVSNKVEILFIGEAPGYRGCLQTGVPFTAPSLLAPPFAYYEDSRVISTEVSASVVWNAIGQNDNFALWNIFPFHPHKFNCVESNRAPTASEIKNYGISFYNAIKNLLQPKQVMAIGRRAQHALNLDDSLYLRHPSFGGKREFETKLAAKINAYNTGLLQAYSHSVQHSSN